jgi:hypothetical protein
LSKNIILKAVTMGIGLNVILSSINTKITNSPDFYKTWKVVTCLFNIIFAIIQDYRDIEGDSHINRVTFANTYDRDGVWYLKLYKFYVFVIITEIYFKGISRIIIYLTLCYICSYLSFKSKKYNYSYYSYVYCVLFIMIFRANIIGDLLFLTFVVYTINYFVTNYNSKSRYNYNGVTFYLLIILSVLKGESLHDPRDKEFDITMKK